MDNDDKIIQPTIMKMSRRADLKIRLALYQAIFKKQLAVSGGLFRQPVFRYAAVAVIILSLIISVPVYAYASPAVSLEHPLFPIKQSMENLELNLSFSPAAKTETYAKIAEHRIAEAKVISTGGQTGEGFKDTMAMAVENYEQAQVEAEKIIKEPEKEKLRSEFEDWRKKQHDNLVQIARNVGISTDEEAVDSIVAALDMIKVTDHELESTDDKREEQNQNKDSDNSKSKDIKEIPADSGAADSATATSANEQKPFGDEIRNDSEQAQAENNSTDARQSLDTLKDGVETLKEAITQEEFAEEDIRNFMDRLDKRIRQAEERIEVNDLKDLSDIINSAEALKDNARNFIRPLRKKESDVKSNENKETEEENSNRNSQEKND